MKNLLIGILATFGGVGLAQAQVASASGFRIISSCGSGTQVLGVQNESLADQAEVVLQNRNDSLNSQVFQFVSSGGGYQITNANSGKVLDVYQALTAAGTPIRQFTDNGGANQIFKMVKSSD